MMHREGLEISNNLAVSGGINNDFDMDTDDEDLAEADYSVPQNFITSGAFVQQRSSMGSSVPANSIP